MDTVIMDVDQKNKVTSSSSSPSSTIKGSAEPGGGATCFKALREFDVYDHDPSRVRDDSDLKALLMQTSNRSVIAVEDLDRFFKTAWATGTGTGISGMLNFMDGITSCCREEQITVFTMSSSEGVDPTAIRPGRIDVQMHFPLCGLAMVKVLGSLYRGAAEACFENTM